MDLPAVCLLHLTQDDHSLGDHTSEFLDLAYQTLYPDSPFISFYWTGLNPHIKQIVLLPVDGP